MDRSNRLLSTFILLIATLSSAGCVKSQNLGAKNDPFEAAELDACLAIIIDMSGSFASSWDDRAYALCMQLLQQFFDEGLGSESRVVLGQLSGSDNVILFEGSPAELRNRFRSPDDLNTFLHENSSPNHSPVFEATGKTLDYVSAMPGVTENTRVLTVILSDMVEGDSNAQTRSQAGYRMLESIKRYREQGGGLALYFVEMEETARWRRIFDMAGYEPGRYVIESSVVANPTLPRFD